MLLALRNSRVLAVSLRWKLLTAIFSTAKLGLVSRWSMSMTLA
jgi:hypothetical protein